MPFTVGDYEIAIERAAIRSLMHFRAQHPESYFGLSFAQVTELDAKLLVRAFRPKATVKIMRAMKRRGHKMPEAGGPNRERPSFKRNMNRTLAQITDAVKRASERLERARG